MLSLPWARVQSLVRELRSRKPSGSAKKKKKSEEWASLGAEGAFKGAEKCLHLDSEGGHIG